MSGPKSGKAYTIQYKSSVSFSFKGKTYTEGSVFPTDDPCEVGEWLAAARAAYKAATGEEAANVKTYVPGGLDAVYQACRRRHDQAIDELEENFKTLTPESLGDVLDIPAGLDDVPATEETPESLGAPTKEPIAEVGVENPEELPDYAKSVEGVADGQDVLDRIKSMRESGMSEEEIAEAFRKNVPPDDDVHPELSAPLNTSGLKAADPVLLFSGQFDVRVVDVEIASVGFPLRFERVHRSGPRYFGPLGFNWDHVYNQQLRLLGDGRVAHWTGNLQEHVYVPGADGNLAPPQGVHRLVRRISAPSEDERWELVEPLGKKWIFARPPNGPTATDLALSLVRIEDRHGNHHVLDYDAQGRLARVVDSEQRAILLRYGECDLIEEVSDHTGRRWLFLHDEAAEHIVAVRTPEVDGAPLQTEYTYDDAHPDASRQHGIVRIFDGERVVVENEYGRELGPSYGRVVRQWMGGVLISYEYSEIQAMLALPEHVNAPAWRTEVRREGEGVRVYTFNYQGDLLDERLRLVKDGTARVVAYAYRYDIAGNLSLRMEPDGVSTIFDYDAEAADPLARGNLLRASVRASPLHVAPTRTVFQARYEPRYQLAIEQRDERGSTTRFVYDFDEALSGTGRLVRTEHPDATLADGSVQSAVDRYTCNTQGRWTECITAAGKRHTRAYHPSGMPGAGLVSEEVLDADGVNLRRQLFYDAFGRLVRMVDGRGNTLEITYDSLDRVTSVALPAVDGIPAVRTAKYDAAGRVVREETPRGAFEDPLLGTDRLTTLHLYDEHGRRIETRVGVGSSVERRYRFAYDADGRMSALEDPLGRIGKFRYDERGLVLERILAAGTPEERRNRYSYDRTGRQVRVVEGGRERGFEYDAYGRPSVSILPDGTRQEAEYGPLDVLARTRVVGTVESGGAPRVLSETRFEHDERSRLRRVVESMFLETPADGTELVTQMFPDPDGLVERVVDPSGAVWSSEYDGAGAPTKVTDPLGNSCQYTRDVAGNVEELTIQERRFNGQIREQRMRYTYDARNRRRTQTDSLGNVTEWRMDARDFVTSVTDPSGASRRFHRGLEGEVVRAEQDVGGALFAHHFERDAAGRLLAYTDPAGQRTLVTHNQLDEIVTLVLPDGQIRERGYHASGELSFDRHEDGREVRLAVDDDERRVVWQATPGPLDAVAPPQVVERDGLGRVVRITAGTHVVTRRHDSMGHIVSERSGNHETTYAFDPLARSFLRTRSDGRAERVHFDVVGRVERVVLVDPGSGPGTAGLELCRYEYDGVSRLAARADGNGVRREQGYDGGGRLASWTLRSQADTLASIESVRDAQGHCVAVARQPAPLSSSVVSYDRLSRLTSRKEGVALPPVPSVTTQHVADTYLSSVGGLPGNVEERFEVDFADQTLRRETRVAGEPPSFRELTPGPFCKLSAVDGVPVVHDGHGNLVDDGERQFVYDAFDRLKRVVRKSDAAVLLEQEHDGFGRVAKRSVLGGNASSFLYEGSSILGELTPGGGRTERVPGAHPGETVCVTRNSELHWLHQDELCNLLATTNASGSVVDRYAYSSFGKPRVANASGALRSAPASEIEPIFGGHSFLPTAGIFMMGPRAYEPDFGRFLQPDPAWPRDSASPYAYAGHDPVNVIDLTGLSLPQPGASGAGAGQRSSGVGGQGGQDDGEASVGGIGYLRGAMTIGWGLVLLGFAALVLSGPVGWFGMLAGTMLASTGFALGGVGIVQIMTTPYQTKAKAAELDHAISLASQITSGPGSTVGAAIAAATGNDVEKGAFWGGMLEAGGFLTHGLAELAWREWVFRGVPKLSYEWDDTLRIGLQEALGRELPWAGRFNPLFPRTRWGRGPTWEWFELSHFIPKRWTVGFEWLFNRPWNLKGMWAGEHALVDAHKYKFMKPVGFKDVYPMKQGLEKLHGAMPTWMLHTEYGLSRLWLGLVQQAYSEGADEDELRVAMHAWKTAFSFGYR
jgi:RHS repeat-associated protein